MTQSELIELEAELNSEFANRNRLGGYSTDANGLLLLTKSNLIIVRHLIQLDKEMTKLKRTTVFKKKKK